MVGLEPDHDPELAWAMRIAEREWATEPEPDLVIKVEWPPGEEED